MPFPFTFEGLFSPFFTSGNPFEEFLRQAFDPQNQSRARPAAASVVANLPVEKIAEKGLICPICQDEFPLQTEATNLTCHHIYHRDCLLPWLKEHNTCPQCRYELKTDDDEYNKCIEEKNSKINEMLRRAAAGVSNPTQKPSPMDIDISLSTQCGFSAQFQRECALLEDFSLRALPCGHAFHTECLDGFHRIRGLEQSMPDYYHCPTCRTESYRSAARAVPSRPAVVEPGVEQFSVADGRPKVVDMDTN